MLLIKFEAPDLQRAGAGGDKNVLGKQGFPALDGHLARPGQPRPALDHPDLVLAQQACHAACQGVGRRAGVGVHLAVVQAGAIDLDPQFFHGAQHVEVLRLLDEVLGGDTAPVQAHPARGVHLHHGDRQSQLRRADGGDVAAGSGTDDRYVCIGIGHGVLPNSGCC